MLRTTTDWFEVTKIKLMIIVSCCFEKAIAIGMTILISSSSCIADLLTPKGNLMDLEVGLKDLLLATAADITVASYFTSLH